MIVDTRVTVTTGPLDPAASAAAIDAAVAPSGVTRVVLVQPHPSGTDEPHLLDTLAALGPRAAGVVAVDPDAVDAPKAVRLAASGIRGVLFAAAGAIEPGRLEAHAALARQMRGHVELAASPEALLAAAPRLAALEAPVVIEHAGAAPRDGEVAQRLLALFTEPYSWVKLLSGDEPVDPAWLRSLLDAAPQRCVWGSRVTTPPRGDGAAHADRLAAFRAAVVDGPAADRVLGENAAKLYGF